MPSKEKSKRRGKGKGKKRSKRKLESRDSENEVKQSSLAPEGLPRLHVAVLSGDERAVEKALKKVLKRRDKKTGLLPVEELIAFNGSTALHFACAYSKERMDPRKRDEVVNQKKQEAGKERKKPRYQDVPRKHREKGETVEYQFTWHEDRGWLGEDRGVDPDELYIIEGIEVPNPIVLSIAEALAQEMVPNSRGDSKEHSEAEEAENLVPYVDVQDTDGRTAIHISARQGLLAEVKLLSKSGKADPNLRDNKGRTPMHLAARSGQLHVCCRLLMQKAIPDTKDYSGKSPLDIAQAHGYRRVANLIVSQGGLMHVSYEEPAVEDHEETEELDDVEHDEFGWEVRSEEPLNHYWKTLRFPTSNKKIAKRERSREKKWTKMLSEKWWYSGGEGPTKKRWKKVQRRVLKGIPDCKRGEAWARLVDHYCEISGEFSDEFEVESKEGVYQQLLERVLQDGSVHTKQIDIDVLRTARDHRLFTTRFGHMQRSLFRVLRAYSVHDKTVGYTQGMSGVTSLILTYIPEEEQAFQLLNKMMHGYRMAHKFEPTFEEIRRDFEVHGKLLNRFLPELYSHLTDAGMFPSLYCTKMFLTFFMNLSPPVYIRIWDYILCNGPNVVFCCTLALMEVIADQLMQVKIEGMMVLLTQLDKNEAIDPDRLLRRSNKYAKMFERLEINIAAERGNVVCEQNVL